MKYPGSFLNKCFLLLCCMVQFSILSTNISAQNNRKHSVTIKKFSKARKYRRAKFRSLGKRSSWRKRIKISENKNENLAQKISAENMPNLQQNLQENMHLKTLNEVPSNKFLLTLNQQEPTQNINNNFSLRPNGITKKISLSRLTQYLKAKEVFKWPLKSGYYMSSPFGSARARGRVHAGIDLAAPKWTPVYASAKGSIEFASRANAYGNMVLIKHNKNFKSRYAHLHKISVQPGRNVKSGDLIGYVGHTGYVMGRNGDHLHFEVLFKERPINPSKILP